MLEYVLVLHSFLLTNTILLLGYATFCISILWLRDISFTSSLLLLWLMLVWNCMYKNMVPQQILSIYLISCCLHVSSEKVTISHSFYLTTYSLLSLTVLNMQQVVSKYLMSKPGLQCPCFISQRLFGHLLWTTICGSCGDKLRVRQRQNSCFLGTL
jgi:hypothetical protein